MSQPPSSPTPPHPLSLSPSSSASSSSSLVRRPPPTATWTRPSRPPPPLDDSAASASALSVYDAAADYFNTPESLGYDPAKASVYLALLHTGGTFQRWSDSGSGAKRLLWLSDSVDFLCLVDAKKKSTLDKDRRAPPHARGRAARR